MRSYAASEWTILRGLRIPNALPFFFTALKLGTTLALIGAIVGEYFGGSSDVLGRVIVQSASALRFDVTWAAIILGSATGILLYLAITAIERFVIPWHASQRERRGLAIARRVARGVGTPSSQEEESMKATRLGLVALAAVSLAVGACSTPAASGGAGSGAAARRSGCSSSGRHRRSSPAISPPRTRATTRPRASTWSSSPAVRTSCRSRSARRPTAPSSRSRWLPKVLEARESATSPSDLVNIAQVFQRSGTLSVSWKDSSITSPEQFKGKKVGVWDFGNEFEVTAGRKKFSLEQRRPTTRRSSRHST